MSEEPRRGRRRALVFGAGAAAVVVGAGAAAAVGFGGGSTAPPPDTDSLPPATAKATVTTLTATEKVSGTLGYGTTSTLSARGNGTLTSLAAPGTVVGRGEPAYSVNELPVTALHGTVPAYRSLAPNVTGKDVRQLEENLNKLGYTGFTVDQEYTDDTADAVRDWQSDLGREETGTVAPTDIVVVPGDVRVANTVAAPGDPATGPVLTHTGTTRSVTVALDVADQHLVKKGVKATVTLPDGKNVAGTVASVGTVASAPPEQESANPGAAASEEPSTVEVAVSVADQTALGTLDSAPVDVTLVSDTRENVLAVPVGALVALAEGGYGVEVVDGDRTSFVAVETGMFADGEVEVTGIEEGTVVGVPR